MIKFTTLSGSLYEVDESKKLVRRLFGTKAATSRQGNDGEWRSYSDIFLMQGKPCIITYNDVPLLPGSDPSSIPGTITSNVQNIERED